MALNDVEKYDKVFITMSERVNAFFINIFYNGMYSVAIKNITSGKTATGDEYRRLVDSYVIAFKTVNKTYESECNKLYNYYRERCRITNDRINILSFDSFVRHVANMFVPEYMVDEFNKNNRNMHSLVNTVLVDLVATLGVYMTTPDMMRNIIENRKTQSTATIIDIQDYCRSFMQTTKERLHNIFLSSKSEAKSAVSLDIINNMKSKLRELVKIKCKYENIIESYKSNELMELNSLRDENKKLRQIIEIMMAERKNHSKSSRSSRSSKLDNISESESGESESESDESDESEESEESEDKPPDNIMHQNNEPVVDIQDNVELNRTKVRRARAMNVMAEFQNDDENEFEGLV